jgi:putative ABC transport system permease protein
LFGIIKISLKLLMNDRAKFFGLLMGITFSVFLMTMMMSMFTGIISRASASIDNVGAKLWVLDPAVSNLQGSIPLPDYVLDYAKSLNGVAHAEPIYFGSALAKLQDGSFQAISVIGLDDNTLFGRPQLIEGNIEDIFAESGFIVVKDAEFAKLNNPKIGTEFELNDNRVKIVGIATAKQSGLFGIPTLYTTYHRAITYIPSSRFTLSYVLIEPKSDQDIPLIKYNLKKLGYQALTKDEFIEKVSAFYKFKTGLGINVLLMTVISFIVGLSIAGQTFYSFITENMEKFGALKAIGAKRSQLITMVAVQANLTCILGYGLGVGLASVIIFLARMNMPDYAALIIFFNLLFAFILVLIIAAFSSFIGIRKVLQIQPFDIFRG